MQNLAEFKKQYARLVRGDPVDLRGYEKLTTNRASMTYASATASLSTMAAASMAASGSASSLIDTVGVGRDSHDGPGWASSFIEHSEDEGHHSTDGSDSENSEKEDEDPRNLGESGLAASLYKLRPFFTLKGKQGREILKRIHDTRKDMLRKGHSKWVEENGEKISMVLDEDGGDSGH